MPIGTGQVLGGTEIPRFAFIGDQLIPNGDFNVDTTGWAFVGDAGGITRVADPYHPWGDYSLEVNDGDLSNYAYATTDVEMATGGAYVTSAWFRREASNTDNAYIEIQEPDSTLTYEDWGTSVWTGFPDEQYNLLVLMKNNVGGVGNGELHLYPASDTVAALGKCYCAHVQAWPLQEWFVLGTAPWRLAYVPSHIEQSWDPVFRHRHQSRNGKISREILGYRYQVTLGYPIVQGREARLLMEMASGRPMFLWPHYTGFGPVFFGLPVRCVDSFECNYPQKSSRGDGYIGRVIMLTFRAFDLVPGIPSEMG